MKFKFTLNFNLYEHINLYIYIHNIFINTIKKNEF